MFFLGTIACNKHGLSHKVKSGTKPKEHQAAQKHPGQVKGDCVVQPVPKAFSLHVGKAKLAMMFGLKVLTCDTVEYLEILLPYEHKSTRHAVAKLHLVAQPDSMCIVSRVCLQGSAIYNLVIEDSFTVSI